MKANKEKAKTALQMSWFGTCSLVCRDPLTFLPDKSQCGCTAQTGRDSAGQGSGHKKEVIEFLVDLAKSSNGK